MVKKAAEKRGRGRPSVADEERKSVSAVIRITAAEKALFDDVSDGNFSAWARAALLKAAARQRRPNP